MQDSLLAQLRLEVPGVITPEILRIYCLYFCRLIDSDTAKAWIRAVAEPNQVDSLLETKYALDDSDRVNAYWRAVHSLGRYKRLRKEFVRKAAQEFGVPLDDLTALLESLRPGEREMVYQARTVLRDPYTPIEVCFILDQLTKHIDSIVYKRLRYVADNDYSRDREDLAAELRAYAVRLVRRYEIEAETYEHMVRLVARGVQNHGTNLAIRANRGVRRVLQRLVKQPNQRDAWWYDVKSGSVRKVSVPRNGGRRVDDEGLRCEVHLGKDGSIKYAQVDYLYRDRREALEARLKHRRGKRSARRTLLDLSAEVQDDFIPTTMSIHKKIGRDDARSPMTLADVIPSPVNTEDSEFIKVLNRESTRLVREFTDCVLCRDQFFIDYLDEQGLDSATLTERRLGTEACRFLGVSLKEVKQELRRVPEEIWSSPKAQQIYS